MQTTSSEWIAVASVAFIWSMTSTMAAEGDAAVGPSRAELIHSWDLNKDGKIDESEAEVARAKMRRAKLELQQQGATGKPLVPEAGRDDSSALSPRRDPRDPLKPDQATRDPLGEAFRPVKPSAPKSDAGEPVRESSGRDRDLNAGRPIDAGRGGPNAPITRERTTTGGPVTGGARAGAPALRPGYGASGPKVDLNAGRLPTGLPPAQGMRPQVGSAPFRGGFPGNVPARTPSQGVDPRGTVSRPRANEPARPPLMPSSPSRVSAEDIGLP